MTQDIDKQPVILMVDDTPANLGVLFELLNESGFRVLVAEDGESALSRAEYAQPDLILLDVMMPGMDGFSVCQKLKEIPATMNIPVIFMTAKVQPDEQKRYLDLGADGGDLGARVRSARLRMHREERLACRAGGGRRDRRSGFRETVRTG